MKNSHIIAASLLSAQGVLGYPKQNDVTEVRITDIKPEDAEGAIDKLAQNGIFREIEDGMLFKGVRDRALGSKKQAGTEKKKRTGGMEKRTRDAPPKKTRGGNQEKKTERKPPARTNRAHDEPTDDTSYFDDYFNYDDYWYYDDYYYEDDRYYYDDYYYG